MTEWRLASGAAAAALKGPDARTARPQGSGEPKYGSHAPPDHKPQSTGSGAAPASLIVNGETRELRCRSHETLAQVLHDNLGLIGTRVACDRGECGACTVLVDGRTRLACMTLAGSVAGRRVTTVEGLAKAGEPADTARTNGLGRLQSAFLANDAYQCGYCTPGFLMAAAGLLQRRPQPTRAEVVSALAGNLCRCGAYEHIVAAVLQAAGAGAGRSGEVEEGPA